MSDAVTWTDPENRDSAKKASDKASPLALVTAVAGQIESLPGAATQPELAEPAEAKPPNKNRKKAGGVALGLVVVLVGCFAWYPMSDHHAPFASSGSITANVTQVAARVAGPVTAVAISDNAAVKAGQVLFTIDDTTYRMDVELARAQLDQVTSTIGSSVAAIPAAAAKVEQAELALTIASDDFDRARQLSEKGLVAPAKLAQAETAKSNAALNVQAAKADLERMTMASGVMDDTNPNIRTAHANLAKAEFALESTTVIAPADGYVTNVSLAEGQFVGAGTPALTFINPTTQMVIADFRENQLINVEAGDKAIVTFEAAPGKQFEGTVESIAWGINSGRASVNGLAQPSTDTRWFPPARKIPVRIALDDLSQLPANIRLGSEAGVLIVPEDGIIPAISRMLLGISGLISGLN